MFKSAKKTTPAAESATLSQPEKQPKRRSRWRKIGFAFLILILLLTVARAAMPTVLRWYVNRTIDRSPIYEGRIGDIEVSLWRGAYTINDIRIVKRMGNIPVPLFAAKRIDFAMEWSSLLHRKAVGKVVMQEAELNFVDAPNEIDSQTGVGPWLEIIRDLFPFRINSTHIYNGQVHFRAYQVDPPVDVYLSQVDASIDNLTNIYDDVTPMYATVKAKALAMDQAKVDYQMKLDPFSYRPTFQLAVRLLGLDVQKLNEVARHYGKFDFEAGWFDLVVEVDAKEGQLEGYVKPLFRNIRVFSLDPDIKEDNVVEFFWEALVGVATGVLKNAPRDQFGTVIPFRGDPGGQTPDLLATIGNVLYNAFVRAYLPKLEGLRNTDNDLHFEPASITDSAAVKDSP